MKIKDTLTAWMEYLGTDPTDLARRHKDLHQPTVHRIASGESGDPRIKTLEKIANALGITVNELQRMPPPGLYIEGEFRHVKDQENANLLTGNSEPVDLPVGWDNVRPSHQPNMRGTPVLSWITAGELCESQSYSQITEPEDWMPTPRKAGPNTYALKVSGKSMTPKYQDGCFIYVDPDQAVNPGDDVVVCTPEGGTTFKRLNQDGDVFFLEALNKDWPKSIIKMPVGSRICGRVIGSYTEN